MPPLQESKRLRCRSLPERGIFHSQISRNRWVPAARTIVFIVFRPQILPPCDQLFGRLHSPKFLLQKRLLNTRLVTKIYIFFLYYCNWFRKQYEIEHKRESYKKKTHVDYRISRSAGGLNHPVKMGATTEVTIVSRSLSPIRKTIPLELVKRLTFSRRAMFSTSTATWRNTCRTRTPTTAWKLFWVVRFRSSSSTRLSLCAAPSNP